MAILYFFEQIIVSFNDILIHNVTIFLSHLQSVSDVDFIKIN